MGYEDTLWLVEVTWVDGSDNTLVVSPADLDGLNWETWISNFLVKATRPHWVKLGALVFYTQNVRSIALVETIEKED